MVSKVKAAAVAVSTFGIALFLSLQTHMVGASRHYLLNGVGDIFAPIYGLFNGLFQGALPLVFLFFIIILVLTVFSSPLWLKKIFGATK